MKKGLKWDQKKFYELSEKESSVPQFVTDMIKIKINGAGLRKNKDRMQF